MAARQQKAVAAVAILAIFLGIALNIAIDIVKYDYQSYEFEERRLPKSVDRHPNSQRRMSSAYVPPSGMGGYYNLSCPFEWSKYSCAYMQRGPKAAEIVRASTEYYLEHMTSIQAAFNRAVKEGQSKRIFFTGDSLMRQIFVGIACNAWSLQGGSIIENAEIPWKEEWPCKETINDRGHCFITGGQHSGFDAASIRLTNGMELHFVPHRGFKDEDTAEPHVLERLVSDVARHDGVTFGKKTAMSPGGPKVDVLVYNVGIHYNLRVTRKHIRHYANEISKPLMMHEEKQHGSTKNVTISSNSAESNSSSRTRTIYVMSPAQHYNTNDGQWQKGMTDESKKCVKEIPSNPRAKVEQELLIPGVNVDVLLDYDDLSLGHMHVQKGDDCSHYCMPGVPDVVGARLVEEFLSE